MYFRCTLGGLYLLFVDQCWSVSSIYFVCQCWSAAEVRKLALLIRALNFSLGLQQYTAVFITRLEEIKEISSALAESECDADIQTGAVGIKQPKGDTTVLFICTSGANIYISSEVEERKCICTCSLHLCMRGSLHYNCMPAVDTLPSVKVFVEINK